MLEFPQHLVENGLHVPGRSAFQRKPGLHLVEAHRKGLQVAAPEALLPYIGTDEFLGELHPHKARFIVFAFHVVGDLRRQHKDAPGGQLMPLSTHPVGADPMADKPDLKIVMGVQGLL